MSQMETSTGPRTEEHTDTKAGAEGGRRRSAAKPENAKKEKADQRSSSTTEYDSTSAEETAADQILKARARIEGVDWARTELESKRDEGERLLDQEREAAVLDARRAAETIRKIDAKRRAAEGQQIVEELLKRYGEPPAGYGPSAAEPDRSEYVRGTVIATDTFIAYLHPKPLGDDQFPDDPTQRFMLEVAGKQVNLTGWSISHVERLKLTLFVPPPGVLIAHLVPESQPRDSAGGEVSPYDEGIDIDDFLSGPETVISAQHVGHADTITHAETVAEADKVGEAKQVGNSQAAPAQGASKTRTTRRSTRSKGRK
jgi:hypothetical protein